MFTLWESALFERDSSNSAFCEDRSYIYRKIFYIRILWFSPWDIETKLLAKWNFKHNFWKKRKDSVIWEKWNMMRGFKGNGKNIYIALLEKRKRGYSFIIIASAASSVPRKDGFRECFLLRCSLRCWIFLWICSWPN